MRISKSIICIGIILLGVSRSILFNGFTPEQAFKQCLDGFEDITKATHSKMMANKLLRVSASQGFYHSIQVCIASIDMINEQYKTGFYLDLINASKSELIDAKSDQYKNILDGIEMKENLEKNKNQYLQERKNQLGNQLKNIFLQKNHSKAIENKIISLEQEKEKLEQEKIAYEKELALEEEQRKVRESEKEREKAEEAREEKELDRGNKEKWEKEWRKRLDQENQLHQKITSFEKGLLKEKNFDVKEARELLEDVIFEKMKAFKIYMGLPFDNKLKPPNFKANKTKASLEIQELQREAVLEIKGNPESKPEEKQKKESKEEEIEHKIEGHQHDIVSNRIAQELQDLKNDWDKIKSSQPKLKELESDSPNDDLDKYYAHSIVMSSDEYHIYDIQLSKMISIIKGVLHSFINHQKIHEKLETKPKPSPSLEELADSNDYFQRNRVKSNTSPQPALKKSRLLDKIRPKSQ